MSAAALAQLVRTAPVLTALEADFRRNRWTFTLPPQPVGPGDYLVLRADEAQTAIEHDAGADLPEADAIRLRPAGPAYYIDHDAIGGGRAIKVRREALSVTLYNDHTPDDGRWPCKRPHPALWSGSIRRTDESGDSWERSVGPLVMDDFGTLVPVQR